MRFGLTAGRFSRDLPVGVDPAKAERVSIDRDSNKYNQRTKRADDSLDVDAKWPSRMKDLFRGIDRPGPGIIHRSLLSTPSSDAGTLRSRGCFFFLFSDRTIPPPRRTRRATRISRRKPKQLWHLLNF